MQPQTEQTHIPVPANVGRRLAAFLIDHTIFIFIIFTGIFIGIGNIFEMDDSVAFANKMSDAIPLFLVLMLIYLLKDAYKGISPGKWVLGIAVRDENNDTVVPSFGRLLLRNILVYFWPVEFIVLCVDKNSQKLGDKWAKTAVIHNPNRPGKLIRIAVLLAILAALFTGMYLFTNNVLKNSAAYKTAIVAIEKDESIKEHTGGIAGYGNMPSGNIQIVNGEGNAQFLINVKGKEHDVKVQVLLHKEPGEEWHVVDMEER